MSEKFEQQNSSEILGNFGWHVAHQVRELHELQQFFSEALPLVDNVGQVNVRLAEAGRPDLVIANPALMMPISAPSDIKDRCNNFSSGFYMRVDSGQTPDLDDPAWPSRSKRLLTGDELEALKRMPKFNSVADVIKKWPVDGMPELPSNTHGYKQAFTRMLILFPDFTSGLIAEDNSENKEYIAYQLMSRLVDATDSFVLNEAGEVDSYYLCR